jgi:heme/copper-type cytochrome/quinol oxidase subunit 2
MAIKDAMPVTLNGSWRVLGGLFDEAFRHGRKRLSRYLVLGLLVGAALGVALAIESGGPNSPGLAAAGRYEVCASNVDNLWRYTYGDGCAATYAAARHPYSYHDLIVPARSMVHLAVARASISHLLRIAGLGLTLRAGTQSIVKVSFRTPRAGATYLGECLTACGHDREFASAKVIVVTRSRYERWLAGQTLALAKQDEQAGQLRTALVNRGVFAPNAPQ